MEGVLVIFTKMFLPSQKRKLYRIEKKQNFSLSTNSNNSNQPKIIIFTEALSRERVAKQGAKSSAPVEPVGSGARHR